MGPNWPKLASLVQNSWCLGRAAACDCGTP